MGPDLGAGALALAGAAGAGPGWALGAAWPFLSLLMSVAQKPLVLRSEYEPIVEGDSRPFVHPKLGSRKTARRLCSRPICRNWGDGYGPLHSATSLACPPALATGPVSRASTSITVQHASAGASQCHAGAGTSAAGARARPNTRRSTAADGPRGVQERKRFSSSVQFRFELFIEFFSVEARAQLLQTAAVTARRGVGRKALQPADLLKRQLVPDFQDDHFTLLHRQRRQTPHRRALGRGLIRLALEPARRFELTRHAAPQAPAVVERAIAEAAHRVMLRLRRRRGELQQRGESFLQHILRLAVGEAERTAVQDQSRRTLVIEPLAPVVAHWGRHEFTR